MLDGGADDAAPIKAVLLDVDGTLVDSNDAHAAAWQEAFARYGREVWPAGRTGLWRK